MARTGRPPTKLEITRVPTPSWLLLLGLPNLFNNNYF